MGAIWATPLNECGILAIPAGFLSGGYRRALWANARGGDCDYKDLSQFKPSLSLDLLPHRPELPPGSPRQISPRDLLLSPSPDRGEIGGLGPREATEFAQLI